MKIQLKDLIGKKIEAIEDGMLVVSFNGKHYFVKPDYDWGWDSVANVRLEIMSKTEYYTGKDT